MFFTVVWGTVILQRLIELGIARSHARFILSLGGREAGAEHYKYIVGLHVLFLLSLWVETNGGHHPLAPLWWVPFSLFLLAQVGRYWCIRTLGKFWNTRIYILPGAPRIKHGPYRYLRHPNYWIVVIELLTLPLTFSAYWTAAIFTIANLWLLLRVRIPAEERALAAEPDEAP